MARTSSEKKYMSKRYSLPMKYQYTLASILILFLIISNLMTVWPPKFLLSDKDFLSAINIPGSENDGTVKLGNGILSDRGRVMIMLWSLAGAVIVGVLLHFSLFSKM